MKQKWFWYAGIAAVIVYIFAVIVGGLLYPGYSHISQDVSQLTSTHSPIRNFMNIFFFYNILVALFGLGIYRLSSKKLSRIGGALVITIGLLGLIISWFPVNTRGTAITFTGVAHIVLVSIISLFTVATGFLLWFAYKKTELVQFAKISLLTGVGFLVTGPIAAIYVLSPYAGLLERITIGIFLLWMMGTSILMLKRKR